MEREVPRNNPSISVEEPRTAHGSGFRQQQPQGITTYNHQRSVHASGRRYELEEFKQSSAEFSVEAVADVEGGSKQSSSGGGVRFGPFSAHAYRHNQSSHFRAHVQKSASGKFVGPDAPMAAAHAVASIGASPLEVKISGSVKNNTSNQAIAESSGSRHGAAPQIGQQPAPAPMGGHPQRNWGPGAFPHQQQQQYGPGGFGGDQPGPYPWDQYYGPPNGGGGPGFGGPWQDWPGHGNFGAAAPGIPEQYGGDTGVSF